MLQFFFKSRPLPDIKKTNILYGVILFYLMADLFQILWKQHPVWGHFVYLITDLFQILRKQHPVWGHFVSYLMADLFQILWK